MSQDDVKIVARYYELASKRVASEALFSVLTLPEQLIVRAGEYLSRAEALRAAGFSA